ncbi:MAG: hypothetical protein K2Y29_08410 [Beijerinckiaceae bacterium]|nr:hypothetical protein [Beijerinckiaceae bacterium]
MTAQSDDYKGSNPRQAAARQDRLDGFGEAGEPPPGVECDLLCEDHVGTYRLPFPCVWTSGAWASAQSGEAVEARVVRWRLSAKSR